MSNYSALRVAQLREICMQRGIDGAYMRKRELIDALRLDDDSRNGSLEYSGYVAGDRLNSHEDIQPVAVAIAGHRHQAIWPVTILAHFIWHANFSEFHFTPKPLFRRHGLVKFDSYWRLFRVT